MRLKMDGDSVVTTNEGGSVLPVIVYDDGTEAPLNFPKLIGDVKRVSEERETTKQELQRANQRLETFTKHLNGDDPEKFFPEARKAMDTVKGLSEGELLTAEKLEQLKKEEEARWKKALDDAKTETEEIRNSLQGEVKELKQKHRDTKLANTFASSAFVRDNLRFPPDVAQAYFERHFDDSEDGDGFILKDRNGKPIRSRKDPSEFADIDEGLAILVEEHPDRDRMLQGSGASGTGAPSASTGSASGTKQIPRTDFFKRPPEQQEKLIEDGWEVTD